MPPEKRQSDLDRTEAETLRQAASDAYAALQLAHLRYEHALSIAVDASPTAVAFVRRERQHYADSIVQYSNAAMAWLSYADTVVEQAPRSARMSTTGG